MTGKCEECGVETPENWMTLCKKDYAIKMEKEKSETKETVQKSSIYEDMKESISSTIKLMKEFNDDFEFLNFSWDKICNAMFIARRKEK